MAAAKKSRSDSNDIVVFSVVKDSACGECGAEIWKGDLLRMERERPLCLSCADLDHLEFLPAGDTALTRRARKHSTLSPVVLRFSRARKRYERQGVLVDAEALARAEQECLADAEARRLARERAATRREQLDKEYIGEFAEQVARLFPGCPHETTRSIAEHACLKHSGRVGRSAAGKRFDEEAIELAVRAHVRHRHTDYDRLLADGIDRGEARSAVRSAVDGVLERWRLQGGALRTDSLTVAAR